MLKQGILIRCFSTKNEVLRQRTFEEQYNIRSSLERLITNYSLKRIPNLTLNTLAELSNKEPKTNFIATVNYLTLYNTKRLACFRKLPYLAVLNPYISKTYNSYLDSLKILLKLDFNETHPEKIHDTLTEFSEIHKDAVPALSQGFQEVSSLLTRSQIINFLNEHFRDKINMETITNNYISSINPQSNHTGILNKELPIGEILRNSATFVNDMTFIKYYKQCPIKIDFGEDIKFPYIGNHLDYVFTEILKNSIRAHIESGNADEPIVITVVEEKIANSNSRSLEIRFRDRGGGIPPEVEANVFDYSFSTVDKEDIGGMSDNVMPGEDVDNVAGMGYGLPLAKAYVEQFGGNLEVQSYFGWGTDVYVKVIGPDMSLI